MGPCDNENDDIQRWFKKFDDFHHLMRNVSLLTEKKRPPFCKQKLKDVLDPTSAGFDQQKNQISLFFFGPGVAPANLPNNLNVTHLEFFEANYRSLRDLLYALFFCVGKRVANSTKLPPKDTDPSFPGMAMPDVFGPAPFATNQALHALHALLKTSVSPPALPPDALKLATVKAAVDAIYVWACEEQKP